MPSDDAKENVNSNVGGDSGSGSGGLRVQNEMYLIDAIPCEVLQTMDINVSNKSTNEDKLDKHRNNENIQLIIKDNYDMIDLNECIELLDEEEDEFFEINDNLLNQNLVCS